MVIYGRRGGGINSLIFTLYAAFVFSSFFIERILAGEPASFLLNLLIVGLVAFTPLLFQKSEKWRVSRTPAFLSRKEKFQAFIRFFALSMGVFLIFYAAYYPGGFSPDSINQYEQAVTGVYNDWHPVLHTLLAFTLPLTLTSGWTGSIILFQILLLSMALAYMAVSMLSYSNQRYVAYSLAFLLLNPLTGNLAMYPWKDTMFVMITLCLITFTLHIYFTDGAWLNAPPRAILLGMALAAATIVRHNGVLFTVPLAFALALYTKKQKTCLFLLSFALFFLVIRGPLYHMLSVQQPDRRVTETMGLPMTIIGAVVSCDPDSLDGETLDFAYRVAPKEVWENVYIMGSFNSVKWDERTNVEFIEEAGVRQIIHLTLKCIAASPKVAIRSVIALTDMVYGIIDEPDWLISATIAENSDQIIYSGIPILRLLLKCCVHLARLFLPLLFFRIGLVQLLLLFFAMAHCRLNRLSDWKRLALILPIFTYNFGTMLLLTGPDFRFFYYTFFMAPVLILILCGETQPRSDNLTVSA